MYVQVDQFAERLVLSDIRSRHCQAALSSVPELYCDAKSHLIALSTDDVSAYVSNDVTEQAISRLVVVHAHGRPVIVCSRWVTQ